MSETSRKHGLGGTIIACALVALVSYWGVRLALSLYPGTESSLGPVVFAESVRNEKNPFVADLMAARQLVEERWSYGERRRQISGVSVDALFAEARELLGTPPSESSFQRAVTRFVAGLRDGHGGVIPKKWQPPGRYRWPFTVIEVVEGLMVDGVPDDLTEVQRGDLLLAVDGVPMAQLVAAAELLQFASTPGSRRRRAIEHIARYTDRARAKFELRTWRPSAPASTRVVELDCPRSFKKIEQPGRLATSRTHRMLPDEVAYFRPGHFNAPADSGFRGAPPEQRNAILADAYGELDEIVGALGDARALVLDLRGNPGGTDLLGQFLVDRLVEPGYVYFRLASQTRAGWRAFSDHSSSAPPGNHTLRVPTVCLVDEFTFSTADNVAACLADVHPDIRFVGRPNGAGSGAPRMYELPRTGTRIAFCTQRVQSPKGRMIEGVPVPGLIRVQWTRADVLQGRDPDLDRALRLLAE